MKIRPFPGKTESYLYSGHFALDIFNQHFDVLRLYKRLFEISFS